MHVLQFVYERGGENYHLSLSCSELILKALYEEDLLPRIISGSSVGSLVGALICVTPEAELSGVLNGNAPSLKNSNLITREGEPSSWWDKLLHFMRWAAFWSVHFRPNFT